MLIDEQVTLFTSETSSRVDLLANNLTLFSLPYGRSPAAQFAGISDQVKGQIIRFH